MQPSPQLIQIFVADHPARIIHNAVSVKESKARPQAAVVNELHDRIQLVDAVFQRSSGQHQRESGSQTLDHIARFGFPILDPLRFIQR